MTSIVPTIAPQLIGSPLPSATEMRGWDEATIARGTPSSELMERAGRGIVERLTTRFGGALRDRRPVVILAGPGNNGGDGLVVARLLREHGSSVTVIVATSERYSSDLTLNAARLCATGITPAVIGSPPPPEPCGHAERITPEQLSRILSGGAIIIDALLGTGLTRPPTGAMQTILTALEGVSPRPPVVSIDVPTGINADTGAVYSGGVRADATVAVQFIKRGLMQYPARGYAGELETIDIGISPTEAAAFQLMDPTGASLSPRRADCHKGDFGHVFVVGGSAAMPGAAALATRAALVTGCGWATQSHIASTPVFDTPEAMFVPLPARASGALEGDDFSALEATLATAHALVIGPGLGLDRRTDTLVHRLIDAAAEGAISVVIDGDALTLVARAERRKMPTGAILTPHPGEMARLLGTTTAEVQGDRYTAAHTLATSLDAVVVLKGAGTIVATPSAGAVCPRGTPYLATPGSGDVLSGIIGALVAQGLSPADAAVRGVLIHALAGEAAAHHRGGTILASDIISFIPGIAGRGGERRCT